MAQVTYPTALDAAARANICKTLDLVMRVQTTILAITVDPATPLDAAGRYLCVALGSSGLATGALMSGACPCPASAFSPDAAFEHNAAASYSM